ncbi:MAG: DUF202 domain-containing protein [bacterium]|nr:DUF202 domain-containing protein [bacterium]
MKKIPHSNISKLDMLDPDVRFLLANERTLLAWVRTAIALIGGGVLLTHLGGNEGSKSYMGIIIILMGALMCIVGFMRFKAADEAIRKGILPQMGNGPVIQVSGVIILALFIIIIELLI